VKVLRRLASGLFGHRAQRATLTLVVGAALHGAEEPRLYTETSADPEGGKITMCVWLVNGCRFQFTPPPGWSIKGGATNALLQLTEPDLKAAIHLQLHADSGTTNALPYLVAWRERVKERYPKATWLLDSPCFIADRDAWGCDLAIPVDKVTEARVRVVVVPYPGGNAEFEMRTTSVHESLARRAMRRVLNSLSITSATPAETPHP